MGTVRYAPAMPAGGFRVMSTTLPIPSTGNGGSGDCMDCVNDDQQTSCDDGSTGAPSAATSDTAEQADPTHPLAVGQHNAPEQVGGCQGEGEDGADDGQENEH